MGAERAEAAFRLGYDEIDDTRMQMMLLAGCLLAWFGITVPTLGIDDWRNQVDSVWWTCMAAAPILLLIAFIPLRRDPHSHQRQLGAVGLAILCAIAVVSGPLFTLTGVLGVVATVVAATSFSFWGVVTLMVTQVLVYGVVVGTHEAPSFAGLAWASVMAAMHAFVFVMVAISRREANARAELAHAQRFIAEASATQERLRISRDLHDQIGHQLTALVLNLEAASHMMAGTPAAEPVEGCRVLAKETLSDVRRVVGQLRGESLVHPSTLEGRLRELGETAQPPHVTITCKNINPLPQPAAEAVFRACQEMITNTLKHAQASHLRLDVWSEDGEMVVRGVDDGQGAPPGAGEGNGLRGMRERFEALGGFITVRTSPGSGFRIVARFPEEF